MIKQLDPFGINFSGVNLIEASAGTGKTYNIASLYVRAIVEHGRSVDEILVVTYTKAATKELRDRLIRRLRDSVQALQGKSFVHDEFLQQLPAQVAEKQDAIEKLERVIRSFDEAAVYTIHGFCQHILQRQAFESGALFDAKLLGDNTDIIRELTDDFWRSWVQESSDNINRKPLLKWLIDKRYQPEKLVEELAKFMGKPYLELRPEEHQSLEEIAGQMGEIIDAYSAMKAAWKNEGERIRGLLRSNRMNGNLYPKSVSKWIQSINDWLNGAVPSLELPNKFNKFRQSTINESVKKSADTPPPQHPFFQAADRFIGTFKALGSFEVTFKRILFSYLSENITPKKEQLQIFSYDDLLLNVRKALLDESRGQKLRARLQQSFPVAMVDEFQDTDPIQYEIFRLIYGLDAADASVLFMIGDPKQSIYSFRGADIFTYLKAREDVPPKNTFGLTHNYRSVPLLLDAINALFQLHENSFVIEKISFQAVNAGRESYERLTIDGNNAVPIRFRMLDSPDDSLPLNKGEAEERSANDTAVCIQRLLLQAKKSRATIGDYPVRADDIAVLVWSHHQADRIVNALEEKNIKSVQYSRENVFESDEARELEIILQAVASPGSDKKIKAALSTATMDYNAGQLLQFEENEQAWVEKLEQFARWNELGQQQGVAFMLRRMMATESISEKLITRDDGERRLTNIIHLTELLQQQEKEGTPGLRSLLRWFAHKRHDANEDDEDEQLRLESDENLVKVVTMHRSKGLEYPIVFCPFLWKGPENKEGGGPLVYHENKKTYLDFNTKKDPERGRKRMQVAEEKLAESIRLAYVAITRAEHQCIINWAQAKKTEFSPLGYLLLGRKESLAALRDDVMQDRKYSAVDRTVFNNLFSTLTEKYPRLFACETTGQDAAPQFSFTGADHPQLQARLFERKSAFRNGHSVSSFSSLARGQHDEGDMTLPDYYDGFKQEKESANPLGDFRSFPKGPKPGTAIHHIFENINFWDSSGWPAVINEQLALQSISKEWLPVVKNMLQRVLSTSLFNGEPGLQLANLAPPKMIQEMEFYFSTGNVRLWELLQIIRSTPISPATMDGSASDGFLKGFIDLTFKYKGRFYLLDYKTNYLGDSFDDYDEEQLRLEMGESLYDLQYHIYSIALHRWLNSRLQNYEYEKHFGGAFYLFLRGIDEERRRGIYFDRPDASRIQKLDHYL